MNDLNTAKQANGSKMSFGIIEIFGILGVLLWVATFLVRRTSLVSGASFHIFQVTPNIACGWIATAFFKQLVKPAFGKKQLLKIKLNLANYARLCALVFVLGISSEMFYVLIKNGGFDWQDIVATAIGQIIIFTVPVLFIEEGLR